MRANLVQQRGAVLQDGRNSAGRVTVVLLQPEWVETGRSAGFGITAGAAVLSESDG